MSGVRIPGSSPAVRTNTTQAPSTPQPAASTGPAAPAAPTPKPDTPAAAPSSPATAQSAAETQAVRAHDTQANVLKGRLQTNASTPSVQAAGAKGPKAVPVNYGKDGAAGWVAQREVKGPKAEAVRVAENAVVDINAGSAQEQHEARRALAHSTPQINATSVAAGNSQSLCGAAAMTNALIMSDKGGNNARAIESLANKAGVTLSDPEKKALENFKAGKLSPKDVEHLQQVVYRTGVKGETGAEPRPNVTPEGLELGIKQAWHTPSPAESAALAQFKKDPSKLTDSQRQTLQTMAFTLGLTDSPDAALASGPPHQLTSGGMGGMLAGLKAEGAFAGTQDVTFHNSSLKDPAGHEFNHWTVNVDGTHINSLPTENGGPAQVSSSIPPEVAQRPADKSFKGRVTLNQSGGAPSLHIDTPNSDGRSYSSMGYTAKDSSAASWQDAFKAIRRMTMDQPPGVPGAEHDPNKALSDG